MSTLAVDVRELIKRFRIKTPLGTSFVGHLLDFLVPQTHLVRAIVRLSLSVRTGERVAFIGPNGAGKSTTLKILAGILRADEGHVRVLGLDPAVDRRALAFQIGTVFGQRSQLWYQLPPRDTFRLLGRIYEVDPERHRRRVAELTALFEIGGIVGRPVRQLSLGERMRCEIVASLLHGPRLLFLDEPTIGLDVSARAAIRELLRTESERDGVTLLLTSHDTGDIEHVCERVVVVNHGRVLWDGTLDELRASHLAAKRITLWTEAEQLNLAIAGVKAVTSANYRTDLEFDSAVISLGQVVDAAVRKSPVRDLTVEDVPLDAVIRALYARAAGGLSP